LASIGPETTKTLHALGFKADAEAREHNIPGLIKAVREKATAAN
jgi:uroporphyrinogen-III synthase